MCSFAAEMAASTQKAILTDFLDDFSNIDVIKRAVLSIAATLGEADSETKEAAKASDRTITVPGSVEVR